MNRPLFRSAPRDIVLGMDDYTIIIELRVPVFDNKIDKVNDCTDFSRLKLGTVVED